MVRLIRIQTQDDNVLFDANFDEDIFISKDSQIGLKNLVFEPKLNTFTPIGNDGRISIFPEKNALIGLIPNNFSEQTMPSAVYSRSNSDEFLEELERTLNAGLSLSSDKARGIYTFASSSMFRVLNEDNKINIYFLFSPIIGINKSFYNVDEDIVDEPRYWNMGRAPFDKIETAAIAGIERDEEIFLSTTAAATTDQRYRIKTLHGMGLSRGSGVFYARIKSSVADGANPNGFTMGITFNEAELNNDIVGQRTIIPDTCRNFEIKYTDPVTSYSCRYSHFNEAGGDVHVDINGNPVLPVLTNGGVAARHDIICFKIDNNADGAKIVSGHIYQYGVAEKIMFIRELKGEDFGKKLVPYIFFNGNKNNVSIEMLRFSPDVSFSGMPEEEKDEFKRIFPSEDDSPLSHLGGGIGRQNVEGTMVTTAAVNINDIRFNEAGGNKFGTQLTLSDELAEIIGFDEKVLDLNIDFLYNDSAGNEEQLTGVNFQADNFYELAHRDFLVVEMVSIQLDAYSAQLRSNQFVKKTSAAGVDGGRKNILQTIPYNSLEGGHLSYVASTIDYVDIRNSVDLNIRNIKIRVLDEFGKPIELNGTANITILIKDDF